MALPKDGEYYAAHTLLGSVEIGLDGKTRERDINRRTIYCWPSDRPVLVLNADFKEWTPENEADLRRRLAEMNDEIKSPAVSGPSRR